MKRFQFRFASVQKVRRIEMDLQARALAEAVQNLQRIEQEISDLRAAYQQELLRLQAEASHGEFKHLQTSYQVDYRAELKRQERTAFQRRQEALKKIEEERQKLILREQRKKVFDKLEERDRENYEFESRKAEQSEMDEVASHRAQPHGTGTPEC